MSSDTVTKRRRFRVPPFMQTPLGILASAIILVVLLCAILAPVISPVDPLAQTFGRLQPPSAENWFGTDQVGRDVFSRVIHGTRISVPTALMLVLAAMVVGSALGAIAGYFGKVVDEVIMRIADLIFAFPTIILAMVIAAALGPSLFNVVIAMLIVTWPQYARVARSLVIGFRQSEYVIAGRLMGNGPFTSLTRDILPNIVAPVAVMATLDMGSAILLLAGLSFLGLGAVPPTPEWGSMISDGMAQFSSWWIATFPGLAIMLVVLAFTLLGDIFRDRLDPHSAEMMNEGAR